MKKNVVGLVSILVVMSLTACSNKPAASEISAQNMQPESEVSMVSAQNTQPEPEASGVSAQNTQPEPEASGASAQNMRPEPEASGASAQNMQTEQEAAAAEQKTGTTAVELYVNVLRDYISAGKTDFTVSFIDLDDDSTREMVVFFGESQADGGCLFTIKNEEAIRVLAEDGDCFGQYGGFTYKERGNVFVTENESVTEAQISSRISYYTMENGNAVCNDVTQSITQFDGDESRFYVNDTEVESGKFNSIAEHYGLLEMSTVSYSDGVRVTNGQMDVVYDAYSRGLLPE